MIEPVIRLRCTCYLSAPTIEGREFCDINDRCAAIYAIKWPIKSVKNPDKMSLQELRNEVKERRRRANEFYQAAYQDGYSAGWHACGEKILEEMKVKKAYRRGT